MAQKASQNKVHNTGDTVIVGLKSPNGIILQLQKKEMVRYPKRDGSMAEIEAYRARFAEKWGTKAPPFIISDFVVCVDTEEEVIQYTDDYFAKQFYQVANHYEWGGEHFKSMPSYATYVALGDAMNAAGGPEKAYKDYIGGNLIGTPEQLIEKDAMRKETVGEYDIIANFSYGGMSTERVYDQMKRFAEKVMPKIRETSAVPA